MNNEFNELLSRYNAAAEEIQSASSLEVLRDLYANLLESEEAIFNLVFETIEDEVEQGKLLAQLEAPGMPVFFDDFDVEESFDQYESYYQRYGCMTPDFVLSWDEGNVLFEDEDGNLEIVARPDVLMNGQD